MGTNDQTFAEMRCFYERLEKVIHIMQKGFVHNSLFIHNDKNGANYKGIKGAKGGFSLLDSRRIFRYTIVKKEEERGHGKRGYITV